MIILTALRARGLLLADGAPTVGSVKTFWCVSRFFFLWKRPWLGNENSKNCPKVQNGPSIRGLQTGRWQNWGWNGTKRNFRPKMSFWVHGPKLKVLKIAKWQKPKMAKNGQIWPKIYICGHFGPNIGIFGPFGAMPDQKIMRTRCLGGFMLCGYQNFCFLPQKN